MYIYKTTNLLNGKIYVGQSKFNPNENPEYLGSGYILLRAIKCYGESNFKKEIIEECLTQDQLCERERYWIATLKANHRGVGYNICEGGEWGDNWSNHPRKEELRAKFRQLNGGNNNPNYGNKWTEDQKKSLADKRRRNPTVIDKATGKNVSQLPHVRKKLSDGKIGMKNPNACLWELTSPIGESFMIEGGIKREIKKFGMDYQQFQLGESIDANTRVSKKGWILTRIEKSEIP